MDKKFKSLSEFTPEERKKVRENSDSEMTDEEFNKEFGIKPGEKVDDVWGLQIFKHSPKPIIKQSEEEQIRKPYKNRRKPEEDTKEFFIFLIIGIPVSLICYWLSNYAWAYLIIGALSIFILLPAAYVIFTRGLRIIGHLTGSKKLKRIE